MQLDYHILWVDDRKDAIDPIKEPIERHLKSQGFRLIVTYQKNKTNIEQILSEKNIDLIAMDYNLGKTKGDEVLEMVRNRNKYIEAILYSQDPIKLKEKGLGLDGIYRAHRSDIKTVMREVINRTIKKTLDLNVMRGLVIAESIDIENQIEEIMTKCFGSKGEFFQEKVLDKHIYGFGQKLHFLISILNEQISDLGSVTGKEKKVSDLRTLLSEAKKIEKEVLDQRNILAHSKVRYDKNGKSYIKGINKRTPKVVPDETWCKKVKANLIKHSDNLEQILEHL